MYVHTFIFKKLCVYVCLHFYFQKTMCLCMFTLLSSKNYVSMYVYTFIFSSYTREPDDRQEYVKQITCS